MVLQLQQPAAAILATLEHLPSNCRVIMDGVPEDRPTRSQTLAEELADAIARDRP